MRTLAAGSNGSRWEWLHEMATPVYSADINSAYVYAMSLLPSLNSGKWVHHNAQDTDLKTLSRTTRFGLFNTRWRPDSDLYLRSAYGIPVPLFHREHDGRICRPVLATNVWLWNPEAANASTTPYATFSEAWTLDCPPDDWPFEWVARMYLKRLAMQRAKEPAEKILKWAMASYYGRVAQRTGWDETRMSAPKFHQIEWAGWITSKCRAMIYQAAFNVAVRGGLVSVDTDGIISTVPFVDLENGEGEGLGQWKVDEYDGLLYLQNGVYWLRKEGVWEPPKLRGIPRTKLDIREGVEALASNGILSLDRRTFVGYGAALQGRRDQWRTWQDQSISINACSAGGRVHIPSACRACHAGHPLTGALHDLIPVPANDPASKSHTVPWLDGSKERDKAALARELAREAADHSLIDE